MKRYCYFMTSNPHWLGIAKELFEEKIAKPVFWLGDDIHYEEAKITFKNGVFKIIDLVHYPFNLKVPKYNSELHDFFYSNNYLIAKERCIKMMDRLDFYGNFSRIDREATFHRLAIFILKELYNSKPEVLIMTENAHSHPQYLALEICKYMGIPIVKFNSWGFVSPLMFMQDETSGKHIKRDFELNDELRISIKNDLKKFFNASISRNYNDGYISNLIIDQKKNYFKRVKPKSILNNFIYDLKNELFQIRKTFSRDYYSINPYKLNFLVRKQILKNKANNLKKMCLKNQKNIDSENEFVYFALHFEPERTTNPDGGFFHDQFLALLTLRKLVPNNIKIYVKEHPSQFLVKKKGSLGRSPWFYELIQKIEGVCLIGLDVDSYKLIKESKFISTITGTVALEAALIGNKALIFGDAWYQGTPNIISWNNKLTYKEIISYETKKNKDVQKYLYDFINDNCFPGFINITTQTKFERFNNDLFKNNEFYNIKKMFKKIILEY